MNQDYSVIIGVYNGREWLDKILEAVNTQSILPRKVIVWVNTNPNKVFFWEKYKFENFENQYIMNSRNDGVYARFSAGLLCESDRILVLDDDTIPGKDWVKNCYDTIEQVGDESIIGYRGIRLKPDALYDVEAYQKGTENITEVSLCGHAWFIKRKHIFAMFEDIPVNKFNGEDTHLSAINQIKYGTKTYIPKQLLSEPNTHGSLFQHLGAQDGRLSTSLGPATHFKQREEVNKYWLSRGWNPFIK